ncbi:MAG: putative membrane-bound spermidine synthase [Lysobacterales bacterium]|jgi:predicted membrane-bound spermidine synthase
MFGLTIGALKVNRGDEQDQRKNYNSIACRASLNCGISLLFSLLVQLFIPLVFSNQVYTILVLPVIALATSLPYYYAGIVISISLTRSPYPIGKVYGIDLLGAATGCLGALVLMKAIDTPSGVLLLGAVAALSSYLFLRASETSLPVKPLIVLAGISLILVVLNTTRSTPFLYPFWVKGHFVDSKYIEYEKWNTISRVTVYQEEADIKPFLWGASPNLPSDLTATHKYLTIDGDALTPITRVDPEHLEVHSYLDYDVVNLAYALPELESVAIIGVGGGRDLLSAKYFGLESVVALDINPIQISLLKTHPDYTNYTNLHDLPGVELINNEARSWFRQNQRKFDLVQMSLIDTWAATGAGAFALSENGLYTTEAWNIFLNDVSDNGVFTVSRWYQEGATNETARLLSLTMAALFSHGITDTRQHILLASSGNIATLVMSVQPFTNEQLDALHKRASDKSFQILASPRMVKAKGILDEFLKLDNLASLSEYTDTLPHYDLSPPTDMRPFFFNQVRISDPINILKLVTSGDLSSFLGHAKATMNLFIIIIFSALMVVGVIVMPLRKTVRNIPTSLLLGGTCYFLLIGFGFMLIEVSLLQALGIFLGHPIYGLSIVLFSLILSTGIGSLLSDKWPLMQVKSQLVWSLAAGAYAVILSFLMKEAFTTFAEVSILARASISVIMILPCGLLLGYGFPTGLTLVKRLDSKSTAWFWGINGAAGVLASSLAIALNISMGLDKTMIMGGLCYALLVFPLLIFVQEDNRRKLDAH